MRVQVCLGVRRRFGANVCRLVWSLVSLLMVASQPAVKEYAISRECRYRGVVEVSLLGRPVSIPSMIDRRRGLRFFRSISRPCCIERPGRSHSSVLSTASHTR